jgi:hypothetical protein
VPTITQANVSEVQLSTIDGSDAEQTAGAAHPSAFRISGESDEEDVSPPPRERVERAAASTNDSQQRVRSGSDSSEASVDLSAVMDRPRTKLD